MGWRDAIGIRAYFPTRAEPKVEDSWQRTEKSAVLGIGDALAAVLGLTDGGLGNPQAAIRAYEQSSAVSAPVNMIAEGFAAQDIVLVNRDDGNVERKHPLLDLVRRPTPVMPGALFWEYAAKMYVITGEAPFVSIGNSRFGPPSSIRTLCPSDMSPTQDSEYGWALNWNVTGPALRGLYGPAQDKKLVGSVWQNGPLRTLRVVRAFSTKDGSLLRGQSKLYSAAADIKQQIEGGKFNVSLMKNGARPSMLISTKTTLGREVFEEFRRRIREDFEGSNNAGKMMVGQGGEIDVKDFNTSVRDMEYSTSQTRTAQSIAKTLKVPIVLLNMDAATFSNMETATLALWDDAILPMANYLLGDVGEWLMPFFDLDPAEWRLAVDVTRVPALSNRALKQLSDRAKSGLETTNEIRKDMPGRDPVDGGDEILVSAALSPLSEVAAAVDSLLAPPDVGAQPAPAVPGQNDAVPAADAAAA